VARQPTKIERTNLVEPGFPLLELIFGEFCDLIVNQFDLNRQTGVHGILGILLKQQIPLGLQLGTSFRLIRQEFLHFRSNLPS
jgi:hypothetical protein